MWGVTVSTLHRPLAKSETWLSDESSWSPKRLAGSAFKSGGSSSSTFRSPKVQPQDACNAASKTRQRRRQVLESSQSNKPTMLLTWSPQNWEALRPMCLLQPLQSTTKVTELPEGSAQRRKKALADDTASSNSRPATAPQAMGAMKSQRSRSRGSGSGDPVFPAETTSQCSTRPNTSQSTTRPSTRQSLNSQAWTPLLRTHSDAADILALEEARAGLAEADQAELPAATRACDSRDAKSVPGRQPSIGAMTSATSGGERSSASPLVRSPTAGSQRRTRRSRTESSIQDKLSMPAAPTDASGPTASVPSAASSRQSVPLLKLLRAAQEENVRQQDDELAANSTARGQSGRRSRQAQWASKDKRSLTRPLDGAQAAKSAREALRAERQKVPLSRQESRALARAKRAEAASKESSRKEVVEQQDVKPYAKILEQDDNVEYLNRIRWLRRGQLFHHKDEEALQDLVDLAANLAGSSADFDSEDDLAEASIGSAASEETMRKVFRYLHKDGDLLREHLPAALRLLSYTDCDQQVVSRVADRVIGDRSFLDWEDFCEFVVRFRDEHQEEVRKEFEVVDVDKSGSIGAAEIFVLLRRSGFTPLPGIVEEILEEIAEDPHAELDQVQQFVHLRIILQDRQGFTKKEADVLENLFKRYDHNEDGTMDPEELHSALSWLGFAQGDWRLSKEAMLQGVETLPDGNLPSLGFLQAIRKIREHEISCISKILEEKTTNDHGMYSLETATQVFHSLGYHMASEKIILECAGKRAGEVTHGVLLEDLYAAVQRYRDHEGFLLSEIEEFKAIFNDFDRNGSNSIDVIEAGGVLRWLGYPSNLDKQQELMIEVDVDGSGAIDFDEFLKLVRKFLEQERNSVKAAFSHADGERSGLLKVEQLRSLLLSLGYFLEDASTFGQIRGGYHDRTVDLEETIDVIKGLRAQAREVFRENQGFSGAHLHKLKLLFEQADTKRTGVIASKDLQRLISEIYPESTQSQEGKNHMSEMLRQVDANGDGELEMPEFLHLMRLLEDQQDHEQMLKEQVAADKCNFKRVEVMELRKIFRAYDKDDSKELSFSELYILFSSVMHMTPSMSQSLLSIFKDLAEPGKEELDFSGFLHAMRRVEDMRGLEEQEGAGNAADEERERLQRLALSRSKTNPVVTSPRPSARPSHSS
mmetsp:Transcript_14173/g.32094  ORF Transcript_14173/g.32094 Transcript_14173/m.32094 type:complete len:1159 (-) Transcript_14173:19-3495(-)